MPDNREHIPDDRTQRVANKYERGAASTYVDLDDDDYYRVLCDAYADGATDLAEGGVPPHEVAHRVDIGVGTAREHLNDLVDAGRAEAVQGLSRKTPRRKRKSYVPLGEDAPDDGGGDV